MELSTVKDIRLAARAMNNDWPVTNEVRLDVMEQLQGLLQDGKPEMKVAAAKAILAADALNAKREAVRQREFSGEQDRRLQLIELAQRIGIRGPDSQPPESK